MKLFFLLNILKTKNSFVLSAMELPFVSDNEVVKKPKIRVCFLWYHICYIRETAGYCCLPRTIRTCNDN